MKACSCCKQEKPLSEFQKREFSKDGHTSSCRECLKARDRLRYPKEKERRAKLAREYQQTEEGRAAGSRAKAKWISANKAKRRAHNLINNAIKGKKLFPEPCSICGKIESVHAHHDDYAKPLNVRWLCAEHHQQWHSKNGPGLNGQ